MPTFTEATTAELIQADRENSDEMERTPKDWTFWAIHRDCLRRRREIRAELDRRKAQQS